MAGYDYSADVFSAGCAIFEFATGELFFEDVEEVEQLCLQRARTHVSGWHFEKTSSVQVGPCSTLLLIEVDGWSAMRRDLPTSSGIMWAKMHVLTEHLRSSRILIYGALGSPYTNWLLDNEDYSAMPNGSTIST
uniref:Protein kinase domain-containing protein n=1 Tax=Steinernema glaseri TaxID=37863 RepID=A0A1I7Y1F6_9BILA